MLPSLKCKKTIITFIVTLCYFRRAAGMSETSIHERTKKIGT